MIQNWDDLATSFDDEDGHRLHVDPGPLNIEFRCEVRGENTWVAMDLDLPQVGKLIDQLQRWRIRQGIDTE